MNNPAFRCFSVYRRILNLFHRHIFFTITYREKLCQKRPKWAMEAVFAVKIYKNKGPSFPQLLNQVETLLQILGVNCRFTFHSNRTFPLKDL